MRCIDIKTILTKIEAIIRDMEQIVYKFAPFFPDDDGEEKDLDLFDGIDNTALLVDIDESMEKLVDIQKEIAEQLFYLGGCRETVRSKLYDKLESGDT